MNFANENSHYLIVQRVKDYKSTNRIDEPTDIESIKKIIQCLVGNISVYLYNENNSSKDLTKELGKIDKDIDFSKLYKIKLVKYTRIQSIENNSEIGEFYLHNLYVYSEEHVPMTIKYKNTICKQRSLYNMVRCNFYTSTIREENQRKINAGADYERFIAQKYIDSEYQIIYNGIEKGMKDEGIDLIAIKNDKTILIQCKNWRDTGYKEVYERDVRAFFGDCFKYILDNSLINQTVGFHFIVAHEETMNKSAINYFQANAHVKYKCIPFEYIETI